MEIADRGVARVRRQHTIGVSLISVRSGLTVWARDAFSWQDMTGTYVEYPFTELAEVADQVIRLHEELAARHDGSEPA